jgi:hypothetical protein
MSAPHYDSGPTSNDLLHSLVARRAPAASARRICRQSAGDAQNLDIDPASGIDRICPDRSS